MTLSTRSAPTDLGSATSSSIPHSAGACAGDQRLDAEIFGREHFEIVQRARHHRADDHRVDVVLGEALEREQLVQPDRIFVGGAARIGRDPPAGADHPVLDQREDEIGIAGVDGEQHGRFLGADRADGERRRRISLDTLSHSL